jgi:hypothetical protein
MKKAVLFAAALMLVATSAFALGPKAYIGIWADEAHSVCSVSPPMYGSTPAYIYILPSERGLQAAEFRCVLPSTIVQTASLKNPGITVELGSLANGISVAFGEGMCQMDWTWIYNLTLLVLATVPTVVEITPHPGTLPEPAYQVASCLPGYPIEPVVKLTSLYFYQSCVIGTEETSWGAIKSMF